MKSVQLDSKDGKHITLFHPGGDAGWMGEAWVVDLDTGEYLVNFFPNIPGIHKLDVSVAPFE